MVSIKLYLFASLRDMLSEESVIDVDLDRDIWPNDDELKRGLLGILKSRWSTRQSPKSHPQLELPSTKIYMLAINEKYVTPNEPIILRTDDEIALIPPVTGG